MRMVAGRAVRLLAIVGAALAAAACGVKEPPATTGVLEARARARVDLFADWLDRGRARGLIGEVGWPADDERWNEVARAFYAEAARRGLWVAAWATGELWANSYRLLVYRAREQGEPVSIANPQAAVVEEQPRAALRGINVEQGAFGEFGAGYDPLAATSPLSNENVGEYGRTYSYPGQRTFEFLASHGISFVRLPFRWERLQRAPGAPLDERETRRLRSAVRAAGEAGIDVILDCHNYGAYYVADSRAGRRITLGEPALRASDFADFWRRVSRAFARERAVFGYALMNEPAAMRGARAWEAASSAAVRAIRSTGDRRRIFVNSYDWGGPWQFAHHHTRGPWIDDPVRNTWYEAHVYFDRDQTARYLDSFDAEVAGARAAAS